MILNAFTDARLMGQQTQQLCAECARQRLRKIAEVLKAASEMTDSFHVAA